MKSKKKNKLSVVKRVITDGWQNIITGLGVSGIDKQRGAQIQWQRTSRSLAESLFSADDIGGKIARLLPMDGIREGVTWKLDDTSPDDASDTIKFLTSEFERLKVWKTLGWAWTVSRTYGGSIVLMILDDGMELDEKVMPNRVRSIQALKVIDRWALTVTSDDIISDLTNPDFGKTEFYRYNTSTDAGTSSESIRIHSSRVLRFDGVMLPQRLYVKNDYWHDSVYGRLFNAIRNYSTSHDNVSSILQEINQPVYTINGLNEALAQDEETLVLAKLNFVNLVRSSMRAVVLDTEDTFATHGASVQGVKDLADLVQQRLIAASEYPHTRLMGESPGSSLGEGGLSQLTDYYDTVKASQEINLRDPINMLADLMFAQSENSMTRPDGLSFQFDPLFQADQKKETETRKIQADIDQIYMQNGVYDAFEVAESRFGTGEYSYETRLEDKDRDEFNSEVIEEVPPEIAEQSVSEQTDADHLKVKPFDNFTPQQSMEIATILSLIKDGTITEDQAPGMLVTRIGIDDEMARLMIKLSSVETV